MAQPPVPFLNRLVDQMLEHADPKADQNIWNLARAAEEVMRQDQGTPNVSIVDREQALIQENMRLQEKLGEWRVTAGELLGLLRPFDGQQLGESREKFQKVFTEVLQVKNNGLQEAHDTLARLREILDPDDRLEHELLTNVASMRMNELSSAKQTRLGTQIEANSAEHLRVVLGAGEHETLGEAAKRVAKAAPVDWSRYQALERDARAFEKKIRELVCAIDESESDDHYTPEQPTIDAVRRIVQRLVEVDRLPSGSRRPAEEVIRGAQYSWNSTRTLTPLPWERAE